VVITIDALEAANDIDCLVFAFGDGDFAFIVMDPQGISTGAKTVVYGWHIDRQHRVNAADEFVKIEEFVALIHRLGTFFNTLIV